jgi:hypothetical protein
MTLECLRPNGQSAVIAVDGFITVVLLVWICGVSFETLKRRHADEVLGRSGIYSIREINTEGVEVSFALVVINSRVSMLALMTRAQASVSSRSVHYRLWGETSLLS